MSCSSYSIRIAENPNGTFAFLANDKWVGETLARNEIWEPHISKLISILADSNKAAINIGTHVGSHSVNLAKRSSKLYAFEPQPIMYWLLRANLANNGCNNYITYPNAVGHKAGKVTLGNTESLTGNIDYHSSNKINYGGVSVGKGNLSVNMIRIDYLDIRDNICIVLVDVEGMEPAVFYGARDLIRRNRPALLFERNYKTITPEMKEICDIPDDVAEFKIEDFLSNEGLRYNPMICLGHDRILIPLPDTISPLAKKYQGEWTYVDSRSRFTSHSRKDCLIVWLSYDVLIGFFTDAGIHRCQVVDKVLHWDNHTVWNPDSDEAWVASIG